MDTEKLKQLITLFLESNPEPSDQQFHSFAESLGVDKETLEAVAYEMLGGEIQHEKDEGDTHQLEELVVGAVEDKEVRRLKKYIKDTSERIAKYRDWNTTGQHNSKIKEFQAKLNKAKEDLKKLRANVIEGVSTHFPEGEGEDMSALAKVTARLKVTAAEEGLSEQQEVLQGEEDPDTTPTNDLALTDGAPVGDTMDDEIQDSLLNDGAGPDDTGLGIGAEKSMLLNDGAPALQLQNAKVRLKANIQ